MPTKTGRTVPVAARVHRFSYAIRNIVSEARAVEARGMRVRYLNIGDPVAFGFKTPPHLIEAAVAAMRDGHNGYLASPGIASAREAVAADYRDRGVTISPDRVLITTGTSEGIDLALNALVNEGEEVLVPSPTYPLYTAVRSEEHTSELQSPCNLVCPLLLAKKMIRPQELMVGTLTACKGAPSLLVPVRRGAVMQSSCTKAQSCGPATARH